MRERELAFDAETHLGTFAPRVMYFKNIYLFGKVQVQSLTLLYANLKEMEPFVIHFSK